MAFTLQIYKATSMLWEHHAPSMCTAALPVSHRPNPEGRQNWLPTPANCNFTTFQSLYSNKICRCSLCMQPHAIHLNGGKP